MTVPEPIGTWQNHDHYIYKVLSALVREPSRMVIRSASLSLTGGAFAKSILTAASLLRQNGITNGSTVAILTKPNHPHMLTIRYAAHLVGATAVFIRSNNPRSDDEMLPAADQANMLSEVDARLLITDAANIARGRVLCRNLSCDAVAANLDPAGTIESAIELDRATHAISSPGYGPGDRLVIVYTSGSTGRPKGVCHSYRAWNNMAAGFEAVVRGTSPPVFLAVTPIAQTVGVMLDGALAAGGSVVLLERFSVDAVRQAFTELGVTDCYLAVPHLYALTDDAWLADHDVSSLRNVIYSGSPAAPHRIGRAAQVFGRALLQSYGSTEAGPITYLGSWEHLDADLLQTVGRPYPGVRVRVCQRDPGRELAAGRVGEVWVKSGNLMEGYLNDPPLNAKVLRNGWLRTGDLGFLDHRGYLKLVGRIGDVIKHGGLKIYPATIERALMMHPDVSDAAVIGVRHRSDVEEAYAAVTLCPGATATLSELRRHLGAELAPSQIPAVIAHWAVLPADDSGKTDRRRLRAVIEQGDGARHGLLAEE
ncbi:MAG TPA: fatty acid--CoA ligase family protein [Streptosporangiaceae bacterium]